MCCWRTIPKGLTDELARRAWWTGQDPGNARRMLGNPQVVKGEMGPELASYLIDYLPFESEPMRIIESLRLVLQPGLISDEERVGLWKRCQRKPAYYLGFLAAMPDDLPETWPARQMSDRELSDLQALASTGNPFARLLLRISSSSGQGFLVTVGQVMEKPANQDVVTLLLDLLRDNLSLLRPAGAPDQTLDELLAEAGSLDSESFETCRRMVSHREAELRALYLLSGLGYGVVRPVFSKSDAIGSLMCRKLEPVFKVLREQLAVLQG
ncbi:MAG: sulfur reduction protein DsrS [Candidatus Thiodiazotropha sp. (ex Dulcina madagascariensis)]|nr:sulfur reduction protein DsrS [Candidatus Thiodiazotropha sp. (ex Dulcina madagascariensis)]MCU7928424.1 sulfur reduction protein DsrS [Candidatus Thiodiazotropha sp. (ex Dulcina madagascariensis)]